MSMMSEQVKELRRCAALYDLSCGREVEGTKELLRRAADTIEALSEKVRAQNRCLPQELEQYREAGTPDECRKARERQVPRKPENVSAIKYRDGKGYSDCDVVLCPYCRKRLRVKRKCDYCDKCGQAIDWSGVYDEAESSLHESHE